MPVLTKYTQDVTNIFELIGSNEDDLTASLGWCLTKCPEFLKEFAEHFNMASLVDATSINLQVIDKAGRTDIEIWAPAQAVAIIEAKVGFTLPTLDQLCRYAERENFQSDPAKTKAIIVISDYEAKVARKLTDTPSSISGINVQYLAWREIIPLIVMAAKSSNTAQKRLLNQFIDYLETHVTTKNINSNEVWITSLSTKEFGNHGLTFTDYVEKERTYFHPIRKGYPSTPPNYIAFRYYGQLQSIHHVSSYITVSHLNDAYAKLLDDTDEDPHFIYSLGAPITPSRIIKTGGLFGSGRHWAAIDLLLTSETVRDAVEATKMR